MTTEIHPSDAAQAHALTQTREAKERSINEVQLAYQEFLDAGERVSDGLVLQVNKAREIGLHLSGLKKALRHGEFGKLFTSDSGQANQNPSFDFSAEYGRTFMRLADSLPNPVATLPEAARSLKDVMIMAGALPEPQRGEQQSHGAMNWFSSLQRVSMSLLAGFGKQREKAGEPSQWSAVEQSSVKAMLRPLVALYNELPE